MVLQTDCVTVTHTQGEAYFISLRRVNYCFYTYTLHHTSTYKEHMQEVSVKAAQTGALCIWCLAQGHLTNAPGQCCAISTATSLFSSFLVQNLDQKKLRPVRSPADGATARLMHLCEDFRHDPGPYTAPHSQPLLIINIIYTQE